MQGESIKQTGNLFYNAPFFEIGTCHKGKNELPVGVSSFLRFIYFTTCPLLIFLAHILDSDQTRQNVSGSNHNLMLFLKDAFEKVYLKTKSINQRVFFEKLSSMPRV